MAEHDLSTASHGTVAFGRRRPHRADSRHEISPSTSHPRPDPSSAFAGYRFPPEVITLAVRWYLRFGLSYRDVEELAGRASEARPSPLGFKIPVESKTCLIARCTSPDTRLCS